MKKFIIFFLLFLPFSAVFGQYFKEIPRDKQAYYKQLYSAFEQADKDFAKDVFKEEFEPFWMALGAADEKFVYDVSEKLLAKRFTPYPAFRHLLMAVLRFSTDPSMQQNYSAYKEATLSAVEGKSKSKIQQYLESTGMLAETRTFYQSNSIRWEVGTGSIEFVAEHEEGNIPAMIFNGVTLKGKTKADSTMLQNCKAVYFPSKKLIKIKSGKITWKKAGLDPQKNYAEFWNAEIKAQSTFFNLDSSFMYSEYFPGAQLGIVREKVTSTGYKEAKYPVFESKTKGLTLENIVPGVDYTGGFALRGKEFEGLGSIELPSVITFKEDGKPFLKAVAVSFDISVEKIQSNLAKITIFLGENDSIFHPGIGMKYRFEEGLLELIRNQEGISESPYYSSYHQLDFFAQKATWKKGSNTIAFGSLPGEATNRASFESTNYFVKARYDALRIPGEPSPLNFLEQVAKRFGVNTFPASVYADARNISLVDAKRILIDLANKGFIYYEPTTEQVTVKQKLFDFLQSYAKKIDYDNIFFSSEVKSSNEPNATIDLKSLALDIYGIKKVPISDSQAVAVYPDNPGKKITIFKNRDVLLQGVVKAGNMDFYGDSLYFSYEKFSFDLSKVDSAVINVIRIGSTGIKRFVPVRTKIHDLVGELQIDMPNNKSGLNVEKNAKYPTITTTGFSYAYYDKPKIANGTYKKEDFYFKIDPFTQDSLDKITSENIRMTGAFVSAGIFPEIRDTLRIMKDYSLGFVHQTPTDGLPLYDGRASFNNAITLTEKGGLQGNGEVIYLTSKSNSERFNFFPDSTKGIAQSINNSKSISNPDVPDFVGENFNFLLLKTADQLIASTIKKPFEMFGKQAEKEGNVVLSKQGLQGSGKLSMYDGSLEAEKFNYNNANAFSDTAAFALKVIDDNIIVVSTENVNAHIDFAYKIGTFKANDATDSKVEFPKNKYAAYMDDLKWYIDQQKVAMVSSLPGDLDSTFASCLMSLHPNQDSLRFIAGKAIFDVKEYIIRGEDVKEIFVADAIIEPIDGRVNIFPDAVIETLQNANIVADYINRFHLIFEASIDIISRKKYHGKGKYNYEDEFGEKQKINFNDIAVNEQGQTFAVGDIPEEQGFKINSYFDYRGKVNLVSEEKGLSFDGSTRIKASCKQIPLNWLAFKAQVDPKNARIPVGNEMVSDNGQSLAAGLMLNESENQIYPAFMSAKINDKDRALAVASGYLWFDGTDKSYKIGSKERADGEDVGTVILLNTESCDLSSQGAFNFGIDMGKVELKGYGKTNYNSKTAQVTLRGALSVDFYMAPSFMEMAGQKVLEFPFLQPVNVVNTPLRGAILEWMGEKAAKPVLKDLDNKGLLDKIPEELSKPYVFADVNFVWDTASSSFISSGALGLSHILDQQLFVQVNGKIQVMKSRRGNEFDMYLEPDPASWYFYRYKFDSDPRMQTYSSQQEYMDLFPNIKPADLELKAKKNEARYRYEPAARTTKAAFLERFE